MQVRVERRGKSSPACRRLYGPANPIRSNTDRGRNLFPSFARRYSDGWLKPCGNVRRRQMIALNDRTRLTDPLAHNFNYYIFGWYGRIGYSNGCCGIHNIQKYWKRLHRAWVFMRRWSFYCNGQYRWTLLRRKSQFFGAMDRSSHFWQTIQNWMRMPWNARNCCRYALLSFIGNH